MSNQKKRLSASWLATAFGALPALVLCYTGAFGATPTASQDSLGCSVTQDSTNTLLTASAAAPQNKTFITPGTVQILGELACGDQDVMDFAWGNPTVTPTPIAAHPSVDMVWYYPFYQSQIHAVMGYWIVPNPTSTNSVPKQIPVPANPSAPVPASGQWIPIAYGDIPYNNMIVNNNPSPTSTPTNVIVNPLTTLRAINGDGSAVLPTQLLRNEFYTLFENVTPNAYNMPAGPLKSGGYNVYTAFTVCRDYQPYPAATPLLNKPTARDINEALVNPAGGLRSQLKGVTAANLISNWSKIKITPTTYTPPYSATVPGPTIAPVSMLFAPSSSPTDILVSTNALYALGRSLYDKFGSGNSVSPGGMPTPAPTMPSGSLVTDANNLWPQLNQIYTDMKGASATKDCAGVRIVKASGAENARWFEPFPTMFTCGQLDMTTDTAVRGGFVADYEALFDSSGNPKASTAFAAGWATVYDGAFPDAIKPAFDRLAADLMSAGVMQVAQNNAHTLYVGSAPSLACFNASPYINNILMAATIPMHRTVAGIDISAVNPNPTGSPVPAKLQMLNPAQSQHPEGSFSKGSPSAYDATYNVLDSAHMQPMTGATLGDSKAIFAMNSHAGTPTYYDPYATAPTVTTIDPIRGADDIPKLPITFAPGQPTGGLLVVAPYSSNTISDPLPPPSVSPTLDQEVGLLFMFNVRAIDPYGPEGCGKQYCLNDRNGMFAFPGPLGELLRMVL